MINEHLSYSRGKHIFCPLRYYIYYGCNFKHTSIPLIKGTLIHKYYELSLFFKDEYKGINDGKFKKEMIDKIIEEIQDDKERTILISHDIIDYKTILSITSEIIDLFSFDLHNKLNSIKMMEIKDNDSIHIDLEREFEYDISEKMDNKFKIFKFIPDILIWANKNGNKSLTIIDIKTGNRYKDYSEQVNLYSSLLKILDKSIKDVKCFFYYVKFRSLEIINSNNNFRFDEYLNKIKEFLDNFKINSLDDYKNLALEMYTKNDLIQKELDKFYPEYIRCKWCMVKDYCPNFTSVSSFNETYNKIASLSNNIQL